MVPVWRNWQTRKFSKLVDASLCEFDSHPRHHFDRVDSHGGRGEQRNQEVLVPGGEDGILLTSLLGLVSDFVVSAEP